MPFIIIGGVPVDSRIIYGKKRKVCRPEKLTCRWVKEITEAIHTVCDGAPTPITQCIHTPEKEWEKYMEKLANNRCINNRTVNKILNFEIDYNKVRK